MGASLLLTLTRVFDIYSDIYSYLFRPNRNLIVSVITETIRFRFGKWWNLKSSCSALASIAYETENITITLETFAKDGWINQHRYPRDGFDHLDDQLLLRS